MEEKDKSGRGRAPWSLVDYLQFLATFIHPKRLVSMHRFTTTRHMQQMPALETHKSCIASHGHIDPSEADGRRIFEMLWLRPDDGHGKGAQLEEVLQRGLGG